MIKNQRLLQKYQYQSKSRLYKVIWFVSFKQKKLKKKDMIDVQSYTRYTIHPSVKLLTKKWRKFNSLLKTEKFFI